MRRICKECGKEFDTSSSRRVYCYDQHYRTCKVCSRSFLVENCNSDKHTCSEECRRKAISSAEVYRTPRFKCTCILCNKEFLSAHPNGKLCPDKHYRICKVCGEQFEVADVADIAKLTCSKECRYQLSQDTWNQNSDAHIAKRNSTMLSRYGVINALQLPEYKEKAKQTNLARYGEISFTKTNEFLEKVKTTNRKRYGKDWYMQTPEYKERSIATCMRKYGVTNVSKSEKFIADKMNCPEKLQELMKFREDPEAYIHKHFTEEYPTLAQLSELCGIRESSIGEIIAKYNLKHLIRFNYSKMEDEVFNFLINYLPEEDIIRNTFKVITPYELDIYLPKYNIAIECDPTWTHNANLGIFDNEPIPQNYHKIKTDLCESKNIRLIHLFGYDWINHKDTCKSIILNAIGKTPVKYYARKLIIREVPGNIAYQFLEDNHRQGGVNCKIRLGLYDKDELLSLMTFSTMRHTIGTGNDNTQDCWELVRFCNKNYASVVGGASKLLKHFITKYRPREIRSFSDRAHTSGKLYSILGFSELRRSDYGYVWVNLSTDKAYSRFNSQKRNIKQFLKDDSIDLAKTEVQIMVEHGFVQVFDSGTITWQMILDTGKEDIA